MKEPTSPASLRRTLVLGAVGAGSVLVAAPATSVAEPDPAGLVTLCSGTAGPVTVPGDLVVPAGESCLLEGTTVLGDVDVRAGGDLIAEDGAVLAGAVLVRADAYLEVRKASVEGQTDLRGSYGGFVDQATLEGVDARNTGFYYAESTTQGGYHGVHTETSLESTWVSGDVTTRQGAFIDLDDTVVTGEVDVRNTDEGSLVCSSEVDGHVLIRGASAGVVQLGAGIYPDCAGNVFAGDVELRAHRTDDGAFVGGNVVRGDLVCTGNDPAPAGAENRVRGDMAGQCAAMEPVGSFLARPGAAARGGETGELIQERSLRAREHARQSGTVEITSQQG